jgi:hypothetical protein
MRWPRWPWPRHRNLKPQILAAEAKIDQAEADRAEARRALEEAKEIGEWARNATARNRFEARLDAAWRSRAVDP